MTTTIEATPTLLQNITNACQKLDELDQQIGRADWGPYVHIDISGSRRHASATINPVEPELNENEGDQRFHVNDLGGGYKYSWSDINEFVDYLETGHEGTIDGISIRSEDPTTGAETVYFTQSLVQEDEDEEYYDEQCMKPVLPVFNFV